MKQISKIIVFALIFTSCLDDESLTMNPEWTQVSNWGKENFARCIAVNGATIFVGTDGEIYRSTNNGDTWTKLPWYSQITTLNGLRSVHIKDEILFGGEPAEGFITSKDYGKTWTKVPNSIPAHDAVYSIASNANFVFIGTYGSGLLRSNDNGESWENVFETKPTAEPIWNIAVDGSNILIFIPGKGLYLSTDNGNSWKDITGGIEVQWGMGAIYIKDQMILIGTTKFHKSKDLGATWQEITYDDGVESPGCLWSITEFKNTIYASTGIGNGAGIFYSKDNGASWTKMPMRDKFLEAIFHLGANDNYIFGLDQYNIHRISRAN